MEIVLDAESRRASHLETVRYRLIDICRGLAATSVLIWHYQHFFYPDAGVGLSSQNRSTQPFYDILWPLYEQGGLAVELFWVLSGFVFAATYLPRPTNGWTFFVNRLARLYPLHLLTLLLVALLQYMSLQSLGHFQIYPFNDTYHFGLNLFMAQSWGLESGYSFNAPTWSISVEVIIYAVFLACLPCLKKAPLRVAVFCIVAAAALTIAGFNDMFVKCALFFFLGVACYTVLKRSAFIASGGAILAIAGFVVSRWFRDGGLTLGEMSLLFSGMILLAASLDTLLQIRTTRMDWFGDATYGTYLLHIPIQIAAIAILEYAGVSRVALAVQPWFLPLYMVTVFGVAAVAFRMVEKPAQNALKTLLLSRLRRAIDLTPPQSA